MTNEQLTQLKKELEEEREEILERLRNIDASKDFGSDVDAFDEETDEAEEFGNTEGIKLVLEEKLRNIDRALEKIEDGSYGTCEICKKNIEPELLRVAPESHLCKSCKQSAE